MYIFTYTQIYASKYIYMCECVYIYARLDFRNEKRFAIFVKLRHILVK